MNRWAFLAVATTLASCGTYLPELTSHEALPLEALIAKIDCEFQVAVWRQKYLKNRTFLAGWQGQYTVTLKSNEVGSAKALTNTFPFLPSKKLAINANIGGGETTTANRTALMKFNLAFDSVKQEPVCARVPTNSLHPFITGRIGFEEWMNRAFDSAETGGNLQFHQPQRIASLGHTFEFSIDVNANAGAGFVIAPAPTININPAFTVDRLDDGIVDVVIAKAAVDPLPALITGLTKEDYKLIAELEKLIEKLQGRIKERTTTLNNAPLANRLTTMDSITIQKLLPNDEQQLKAFDLNSVQAEQLKALSALRDANKADEQEILSYKKQIADIPRKVTAVTTKYHVLSPDRNPEIANTFQQLTLERLNNNLRVPIP